MTGKGTAQKDVDALVDAGVIGAVHKSNKAKQEKAQQQELQRKRHLSNVAEKAIREAASRIGEQASYQMGVQEYEQVKAGATFDHERYCNDGFIDVWQGETVTCPICERNRRLEAFMQKLRNANVSERELMTEWDDLEQNAAVKDLRDYGSKAKLAVQRGHSIVIGVPSAREKPEYGRGKSTACMLICKDFIAAGFDSVVIAKLGYLAEKANLFMKAPTHPLAEPFLDICSRLIAADFLVWDDIGSYESKTGTTESKIMDYVSDARWNARKPSAINSNYDQQTLVHGDSELGWRGLGRKVFNRFLPLSYVEMGDIRNYRLDLAKPFLESEKKAA